MNVSIAKIKANPLSGCDFSFNEPVSAAALGYGEFTVDGNLQVSGRMTNCGNGVFSAVLTWQGHISQVCGRCGQSFSSPTTGQLTVEFVPDPDPDAEGEKEVWPLTPEGADLLPPLLSEIWFQTPMQPLCRPDCRGLCPVCGVDLNRQSCSCEEKTVDPRWEKLKNLQLKD